MFVPNHAWANMFGANVLDWTQLLPAFHKDARSLLSKHLFCRLSHFSSLWKMAFWNPWNQFIHQKYQFMVNWQLKWIISIWRSWTYNKIMFCLFLIQTFILLQVLFNYFVRFILILILCRNFLLFHQRTCLELMPPLKPVIAISLRALHKTGQSIPATLHPKIFEHFHIKLNCI